MSIVATVVIASAFDPVHPPRAADRPTARAAATTLGSAHPRRPPGEPACSFSCPHKLVGEVPAAHDLLPRGKVVKRFQGDRIHRVAWKIVRGLAFHHLGEVYPDDWTVGVTVTAPGETPPRHFQEISGLGMGDDLGPYPGIFAYRYIKTDTGQYWALLLWDAVIITVMFHDRVCQRAECVPPSEATPPSSSNDA
jgi:hypothetical protein